MNSQKLRKSTSCTEKYGATVRDCVFVDRRRSDLAGDSLGEWEGSQHG